MPNIYITNETKENLEKVTNLDDRTQDGEINFLCKQRLAELAPSVENPTPIKVGDNNKQRR
jgi:hypothetical protein